MGSGAKFVLASVLLCWPRQRSAFKIRCVWGLNPCPPVSDCAGIVGFSRLVPCYEIVRKALIPSVIRGERL